MIFSNQEFGIQNSLFHFSIARFVYAVIRLAGNPDSEVVGADTDMRGVDVSAHGGNNGVVNSLQERRVDSGVVDDGMVESSSVDQGGVSLSLGLTLGDVRHNGGGGEGLQAGEHLAQDGSGQSG